MIARILGTSRFLIIVAVIGAFIASATLQIFGLLRVGAVILGLIRAADFSETASKRLVADTVAIIDIFLIGTVLFVISAGLYQLFVQPDVGLPTWLKINSLDDLKDLLTEVIIVALLVAFLGQAVQWTGDIAIVGLGLGTAGVILGIGLAHLGHGPTTHVIPRRRRRRPRGGARDDARGRGRGTGGTSRAAR